MDTYVDKSLGDFHILRERGRGGMGVVYEAVQQSLRRKVALKILPPAVSLDDKAVERFRREASSAARLHHTNIVPIYFVGSELGNHFYAMEYIDGKSLAQIIRELSEVRNALVSESGSPRSRVWETRFLGVLRAPSGPSPSESALVPTETMGGADISSASEPAAGLSPAPPAVSPAQAVLSGGPSGPPRGEAVPGPVRGGDSPGWWRTIADLAAQLAEALHYAHGEGVVHRDIKPSNIMVTRSGRPMIFDFGLAMDVTSADLTLSGALLGTPLYMSPEQAMSRLKVDHRTDVYSLGVTLYELATLTQPFQGTREEILKQIVFKDPPAPRRVNPSIPHDLQTIVLKAIEKDPDRRYPNAADFAADLRRFIQGDPILARPAGLVSQITKQVRRRKRGLAISTIVLVSLAIGAVSYSAYRRSQRELAASRQEVEQSRRTVTQVREQTAAEIERIRQQEAVDRLLADLKAADAEKRLVAVKALSQNDEPRVIAALRDAFGDSGPDVREQVVTALGRLDDRAVLPTLRHALNDPERKVRDAAVAVMARYQDRQSLDPLVAALRRDGGDALARFRYGFPIQYSAGRADTPLLADVWAEGLLTQFNVEWVGDSSAVPAAIRLLAESNETRRQEAAKLLAALGDRRGVGALLQTLRGSTTVSLQQACIEALTKVAHPEDVPALLEILVAVGPAEVRDPLFDLLKLHPRTAIAGVLPRLPGADDRTLVELAALLAKTQHAEARETLASMLQPESPAANNSLARSWALMGLRDLHDPGEIDRAIELTDDPAPLVRRNALYFLGQFDGPRVHEALLAALDDSDVEVLRAAIAGLAGLWHKAGAPGVLKAAEHSAASVRTSVGAALVALEQPDMLLTLLRDPDATVRQQAAQSLGRLRFSRAVPDLVSSLQDASAPVRRRAAEALGLIGHRLAVNALCKALADADQETIQAAAKALATMGDPAAIPALAEAALRSIGAATGTGLPGFRANLPPTLPTLATMRTMSFSTASNSLIEALGRFRRPAVEHLVSMLSGSSPAEQKQIAAILGRMAHRSAAPALAPLLEHADAELRAIVAESLGTLDDPALADRLIGLLDDPEASVRAAAAMSLGRLPLVNAPRELLAAAADPQSRLDQHAGLALAGFKDPASREVLLQLAESDHPGARREAVAALARLGDPAAAALVRPLLDETDRFARYRIVQALAALPASESVPILAELVRNDHPHVAVQAVQRLSVLDDPQALAALTEAARHSRIDVREAAIKGLARQPGGAGVPALLAALEEDHQTLLQAVGPALRVLHSPKVEARTDELLAGCKHQDPRVRAICADLLASVRSPQAVEALLPLLEDSDYRVVMPAAEALGSTGDPRAAAALQKLLDHPNRMLRARAVFALGRLPHPGSRDLILDALRHDPQGQVRYFAAHAIGMLGIPEDREIVSALTDALSGWDSAVRRAAAFSLGEIGGPQAITALRAAVRDNDEDVAVAAIHALAMAAGPDSTPDLLAVLANSSPKVASAAAGALQWHAGEADLASLERLFDENGTLRHAAVAAQAAICRRLHLELPAALRRELERELRSYRNSTERMPETASYHNELAWLLTLAGQDLDEALVHARLGVYLSPRTAAHLHTLADVHRSRGEYAEALAVLALPECSRTSQISPRLIQGELEAIRRDAQAAEDRIAAAADPVLEASRSTSVNRR